MLITLFFSFVVIGSLSVGGGYAAIPLIQNLIVDTHKLMTFAEFSDLLTIAEMTPGPFSINASTFIGMKLAGIPGVLLCTIGVILPSFIICVILAKLYFKYSNLDSLQRILGALRPAVVALISVAGLSILILAIFPSSNYGISDANLIETVLFIVSLYCLRKYKASPVSTIFISGIVGTILYLFI